MMKRLFVSLLLGLSVFSGITAFGAVPKEVSEKINYCIDSVGDRAAAMVAQDWTSLDRMAEEYTKRCKDFSARKDFSIKKGLATAYEQIAIANFNLKKYPRVLKSADECVSVLYTNIGCRVVKVMTLQALKRRAEALAELEKTEKLVAHMIKRNKAEPETFGADVEERRSELESLNAQQSLLRELRLNH